MLPSKQPALFRSWPSIKDIQAEMTAKRHKAPLTAQDRARATEYRRKVLGGREIHEPPCANWVVCIDRLARELKG